MMPDADIVPPDMRLELQKFDEDAEQLIASFFELSPHPIIYHYTNDVGLRGILETGKLWLTDIFNLNDPSELRHGFSHMVNILNSKAVNGPQESKVFARAIKYPLRKEESKNSLIISSVHSVLRATILGSGELTLIMGAATHLVLVLES